GPDRAARAPVCLWDGCRPSRGDVCRRRPAPGSRSDLAGPPLASHCALRRYGVTGGVIDAIGADTPFMGPFFLPHRDDALSPVFSRSAASPRDEGDQAVRYPSTVELFRSAMFGRRAAVFLILAALSPVAASALTVRA